MSVSKKKENRGREEEGEARVREVVRLEGGKLNKRGCRKMNG